ncbi:aminopeptidase C [Ancylomarina sp. 16SWW S1-10-2]|uniref:aminopeptidase C n=1 Tax=Ancylomarina sp. 16SWW S1-10-2 TaxID=2499681 RepID=UPI0012AE4F9E|nr:C1 family peptidase [Ancylomarina sp. 16SWW S1-10-2]MRT91694.1 aminopeptidase [Ancylomarina sp. 16SWW S1-10-2]
MNAKIIITAVLLMGLVMPSSAKKKEDKKSYEFTIEKQIKTTDVKDQYRSGTCWVYGMNSFLESELIRNGKGEFDLSEMFVVNKNYHLRAIDYVRFHGMKSFSAGAEGWDVLNVIKQFGIVPQEAYSGNTFDETLPVHGEMDAVLHSYVEAIVKNKNKKITPVWIKGFDGVLDAYLGEIPESFQYKGKEYTAKSFADELGLNMDDYVTITSFTHHPFYKSFVFEGADNWSLGEVLNVPMDEMMQIVDNAIDKGYSIAWGSDVSEKGFAYRKGVAVVPDTESKNMADSEISKWQNMSRDQKSAYGTDYPVKEKEITQEMRQEAFDNYESTEDHMMHIVGNAKDQNGSKYYLVKNSWGTDMNTYGGYFYASKPFLQYKTISILIHKEAIPAEIAKKLGL